MVTFAGVGKRFGDGPEVLRDITLNAERGDFISLIGPSGCGKSTLLRLIAGLTEVTDGELTVNGKLLTSSSQRRTLGTEGLAYVFQEPTLMPWLRVAANVEVPLRLKGVPRPTREAITREVLAKVRLSEKARSFPRQLSGGQKMRVSIARALATDPKILLLDEPFGALDEMTRDHLNEELLNLRGQQAWTAFFVTHSVSEAVFLSNRVVVLAAAPGRIQAEFKIDLPYPRTALTRQSDAFHLQVLEVSRALRSVEVPTDKEAQA